MTAHPAPRAGGARRMGHTRSDDRAGAFPEDRHTTGAHVVVLAVGRGVDPDPRPRRDDHVLVQDGPPDVGALPDVHAVHQDAVLHPGTALDRTPGETTELCTEPPPMIAPRTDH